MTSAHSLSRALRSGFVGHGAPVIASFSASPLPIANQKRSGYISASVAAACATIAGWYRSPGAFTVPNDIDVACSAAPSHDHAKPLCPWASVQGWKWSEQEAASKPAASASLTHSKSSLGGYCSCEAW